MRPELNGLKKYIFLTRTNLQTIYYFDIPVICVSTYNFKANITSKPTESPRYITGKPY